jgi:Arc/MetJ-type ribon-helix-helix transcriptional regulator
MQIALRVPAEWIEEADKLVEQLAVPGLRQNRSDILRRAIATGLAELAKQAEGGSENERKQKK